MRFWLGGYTADSGGRAEGIGTLVAGEPDAPSAGGPLAFTGTAHTAPSPSWLTPHPTLDVVYAALEGAQKVAAYARVGDTRFTALGSPVDAGEAVCHVAVAPDGRSLIASCWGDGKVVRVPLDTAGRPGSPVTAAAAEDPYGLADPLRASSDAAVTAVPEEESELASAARALRSVAGEEFAHLVPGYDREEEAERELRALLAQASGADLASSDGSAEVPPASGSFDSDPREVQASAPTRVSRAHAAVFLPGGGAATTDLGFDLVRFWRRGPEGLRIDHEVRLPLGSGPRHLVLHPSGHLHVLTEHSCEIFVLARGADHRWRVSGSLGVSSFAAMDAGAELARSHDGEFLYAGLRGTNTIAVARVQGAGESLASIALVESGVDWPRHHLVVRDTLLVAGERSNDVVALTLNIRTGVPGRVVQRTAAPSPTCVLPARRR